MGIWNKVSTGGRGQHTLHLSEPGSGDVLLYKEQFRKGDRLLSAVFAEDQWVMTMLLTPRLCQEGSAAVK